MKNLELLFNYYKEGKISEFTLCGELEDYLESGVRTKVTIDGQGNGSANTSFILGFLPIRTDAGYRVEYLIDKKSINTTAITNADLIEIIDYVKHDEQKLLTIFKEELKRIPEADMTVRDALIVYTKVYRAGLDSYPFQVKEKLEKANLLNIDLIDANIDKLMGFDERTDHIIEALVVNNVLPIKFIDEAKKLASNSVALSVKIGSDEPDLNTLEIQFGRKQDSDKSLIDIAEINMDKVLSKN